MVKLHTIQSSTMNHLAILSIFLSIIGKSTSSAPSQSEDEQVCTTPDECTASLTSVHVIGDLHGDVLCAVSWVNRTGLIHNLFDPSLISNTSLSLHQRLNPSSEWSWADTKSTLVFMGDYVDKGPTSKQTIEFVRDLTLQFPDKVTTLLGNHELELLRDRDARIDPSGGIVVIHMRRCIPGNITIIFAVVKLRMRQQHQLMRMHDLSTPKTK